ncbi:type II restriction endonuclease [Avibacterium paragallinarum]|uniref:type II restriction endonuclease n=1 Tax=Avibacterium paragallinarum TaxID=728 RepID=UPI00102998AA|nr:type II restriction endonuclease [Avibacterium paragallinarum]RZN59269.1 type II restriction endonuclease [Avibacterium paragallinarum]
MDLVQLGSQTARNGFKNEQDVANRFNNWKNSCEAQKWLQIMGFDISKIEKVKAVVLSGYKTDVNVQVFIFSQSAVDIRSIQVKLVSNRRGFNQIDKRWVRNYQEMWHFNEEILTLLQFFTGERKPYRTDTKSKKRMFMTEFTQQEQSLILDWFKKNKMLVLIDIIRGRGEFAAEWVLVAQKIQDNARWVLKNINDVLQHYSEGNVEISPRGSIKLGRVTIQRKGGDNGRPTANMLQFKIDPTELFDINY